MSLPPGHPWRQKQAAGRAVVNTVIGVYAAWIIGILLGVAGWVTHVITCINNENWLFLIAGAVCAPVGAIHGWGIWLGVWG